MHDGGLAESESESGGTDGALAESESEWGGGTHLGKLYEDVHPSIPPFHATFLLIS